MESTQIKRNAMPTVEVYNSLPIPELEQKYKRIVPARPNYQEKVEWKKELSKTQKTLMVLALILSGSIIATLTYLIPLIFDFLTIVNFYYF